MNRFLQALNYLAVVYRPPNSCSKLPSSLTCTAGSGHGPLNNLEVCGLGRHVVADTDSLLLCADMNNIPGL